MSAPRPLPPFRSGLFARRLDAYGRRVEARAAAQRRLLARVGEEVFWAGPWLGPATLQAWRARVARLRRALQTTQAALDVIEGCLDTGRPRAREERPEDAPELLRLVRDARR
jgi:hypothetical protein